MKIKLIRYTQIEEIKIPEAMSTFPRNNPMQFKIKKEPTIIKRADHLCREAQIEMFLISVSFNCKHFS